MIVGHEKPSLEDISQFGVKGMHWGVIRTDPSTMTRGERVEARKKVTEFSRQAANKKYGDESPLENRPLSKEDYQKLSKKMLTIPRGTKITRISGRKDEVLGEMTYAAYKRGDVDTYRAVMPLLASTFKFGGNKRYKQQYEMTFKALDTLKSPSEKERVDAFAELFDKPDIKLKNGKMVTGREFFKNTVYRRDVKTLETQELGLKYYNAFTEFQYTKSPINTAYYNNLAKKGYNAIVDDNDRGNLAKTPLIILNPNGTLKKMNVKPLTADEINEAQRRLQIDNPK